MQAMRVSAALSRPVAARAVVPVAVARPTAARKAAPAARKSEVTLNSTLAPSEHRLGQPARWPPPAPLAAGCTRLRGAADTHQAHLHRRWRQCVGRQCCRPRPPARPPLRQPCGNARPPRPLPLLQWCCWRASTPWPPSCRARPTTSPRSACRSGSSSGCAAGCWVPRRAVASPCSRPPPLHCTSQTLPPSHHPCVSVCVSAGPRRQHGGRASGHGHVRRRL